ncbi:MAG: tetratricopeptide repeat protein [Oligoflexales bacterium]|nr:tetratricopeptide repeat protein [Oligoflexales bacterium]
MENQLPANVLMVDSDKSLFQQLSEHFEKMHIQLFSASDLETAQYRFNKQFFKVVIIEQKFHDLDGLSIIQRWRKHEVFDKRKASFILTTSDALDGKHQSLVSELGRIFVVPKPLSPMPLISIVNKSYRAHLEYDMADQIKREILESIEKDNDPKAAVKRVMDKKNDLGDEYYPFLIELYEKFNQYGDAAELLSKIPEKAMDPLRKLNMEGRILLKTGDNKGALKAFEKADSLAPKNMERIADMIDLYLQTSQPEKAVPKQKELLNFHPDNPDMKFDLFKQLEDNGFIEEANAFCREVSAPKEVVRYFNNKGVALAKDNKVDTAISQYERALRYFPKGEANHLIHFNLALSHLKIGDEKALDAALTHLEKSLEFKADYKKSLDLLEKLRQKQKKPA